MTVVGVGPEGFDGTTLAAKPAVFVPITLRDIFQPGARISSFENRRSYWAYVFGRLKPGLSIEQARTAINVPYNAILNDVEAPLQVGMSDQTMAKFRQRQVTIVPGERGQTSIDRDARSPLILLLAVTVFVLLIACANIANLLLARSAARAGEMAVRLSIGASRRHHHAAPHGIVPAGLPWRRRRIAGRPVDAERDHGDVAAGGRRHHRVPP